MQKAEALKQTNPQLHQRIMDNLMMLDGVLDRDQLQALEQALVWHTDAVWTLGLRLTDDSDGTTTADKIDLIRRATPQEILAGAAQGAANLRQEQYVQRRILEDRIAQGRRFSQAPPPIVPPRGSANVPKDIHRLANKADATDYRAHKRWRVALGLHAFVEIVQRRSNARFGSSPDDRTSSTAFFSQATKS